MAPGYETKTPTESYLLREPDHADFEQDLLEGNDRLRYTFTVYYPTDTEPGHANMFERADGPKARAILRFGASNLYYQADTFRTVTDGSLRPIVESAGIKIEASSEPARYLNHLELTYVSAEQTNQNLDQLGLPEGTFPTFVGFGDAEYTHMKALRAITKDEVLLAEEGWHAPHDALFHITAWALVPPEFRQVIAVKAGQLIADYDKIADEGYNPINKNHRDAKSAILNFGELLDETINNWNYTEVLAQKLDPENQRSKESLKRVTGNYGHRGFEEVLKSCGYEQFDPKGDAKIAEIDARILEHAQLVLEAAQKSVLVAT